MLGYADQRLSELSGLSQAEGSVAWETINFSPVLVTNMTSASSSYHNARGLASASWARFNGTFGCNVTVPVGMTDVVTLDLKTLDAYTYSRAIRTANRRSLIKSRVATGTTSAEVTCESLKRCFANRSFSSDSIIHL
jgi:hypothetical protein